MSWLSDLAGLFLPVQARSEFPSYNEQMAAIWRRHVNAQAYRQPSVDEALGVPAIWAAVTLIADTVGSLSMEAFRRGVLMSSDDAPSVVQRPNPKSTPRAFFRDTAYYLATRGEAWWWIARRDFDGNAASLFPIPPWEIKVTQNDRDRLRPVIEWGDRRMDNDDLRQITYMPGGGDRGVGPLQMCGAAVSVAVEASSWAANFFSGSLPSIIGKTDQDMTEDELKAMDAQWNEKPPNLPRWLTNGLDLAESPFDAQRAQLTESRQHQVGEAARMFTMPGALVEYQMGGSSLTYQNQDGIWSDFQRRCLSPHYLEPIEQEMSDLLTRSTVSRFNLKQLLRSDVKTRMEVHQIAIGSGIYDADTAAREEGYEPGSVDYAPVPTPTELPANPPVTPQLYALSAMTELRCAKCGRLNGRAQGYAETVCKRCGTMVTARSAPPDDGMIRLEYDDLGRLTGFAG